MNAIEFINISKSFGNINANKNISFEVKKGTIHALIGENGAGKSTLMSILFGLYEPDVGTIKVNGNPVFIKDPNDANKLRIGMVHQHFKLVDVYTNLENIILGEEIVNKNTRTINFEPSVVKIKTIQEKFNLHFDLNALSGKESVSVQQKVEIMKMLYRDSDILIFDEPTAVLTEQEIDGLLETFKIFKNQGKTIIFISHKLREIEKVADYGTVIRKGEVVENFKVSDVTKEDMAKMMTGGDVEVIQNVSNEEVFKDEDVVLELKNVSTTGEKNLNNLNLKVHAGEILAIAGIEGNGQRDLEYVVSGMKNPSSGSIKIKPTEFIKEKHNLLKENYKRRSIILWIFTALILALTIALGAVGLYSNSLETKLLFRESHAIFLIYAGIFLFFSIALGLFGFSYNKKYLMFKKEEENNSIDIAKYNVLDISKLGLSLIPSDRHKHGLALDYKIYENTILRRLWDKLFNYFGVLKNKSIKNETNVILENFDVRGAREGYSIARSLSGGNQQKFIVGREMSTPHDLIIINQPTRGLDVGAIKNIHNRILEEKANKKAILLISYELDEVLALADTIAVINEGEIIATEKANKLSRTQIGLFMSHKDGQHEEIKDEPNDNNINDNLTNPEQGGEENETNSWTIWVL